MPEQTIRAGLLSAGKTSMRVARGPLVRTAAMLALLGFAATLGACSKCDVPTPWEHGSLGGNPAACHAAPQPD